jgi:hypothetical protein
MSWSCNSLLLHDHALCKLTIQVQTLFFQLIVKLCKSKAPLPIWVYKASTYTLSAMIIFHEPHISTLNMVWMVTTRQNDVIEWKRETTYRTRVSLFRIMCMIKCIIWITHRMKGIEPTFCPLLKWNHWEFKTSN